MNPQSPYILTCALTAIALAVCVIPNLRATRSAWLVSTAVLGLTGTGLWFYEAQPGETVILSSQELAATLLLFLIPAAAFFLAGIPRLEAVARWALGTLGAAGCIASALYFLEHHDAHELTPVAEKQAADQMLAFVRQGLTGSYTTENPENQGDSAATALARRIGRACVKQGGFVCEIQSRPVPESCTLAPQTLRTPGTDLTTEGVHFTVDTETEIRITQLDHGKTLKPLDGTMVMHVSAYGVWNPDKTIDLVAMVPTPDLKTAVDRTER